MNSKDKGNVAEAYVLAALLKQGLTVSIPYGENARYDMVFERSNRFYTVQCKLGRLRNGRVKFNLRSVYKVKGKLFTRSYGSTIDYYGVYCQELNTVYLVPVTGLGATEASLNLEVPKNKNQNGFRLARDFEIR